MREQDCPFERNWSWLEGLMVTQTELLVDLAATDAQQTPRLLIDGLTESEEHSEHAELGSGYQAKIARELQFPFDRIQQAYTLDVGRTDSFATSLACTAVSAGLDAKQVAEATSGLENKNNGLQPGVAGLALEEVNWPLRALFAQAALHSAAQRGLLAEALDVLRGDLSREHLKLDLSYMSSSQCVCDLQLVASALAEWPNLTVLEMFLRSTDA